MARCLVCRRRTVFGHFTRRRSTPFHWWCLRRLQREARADSAKWRAEHAEEGA
jgi:hypothetical protein